MELKNLKKQSNMASFKNLYQGKIALIQQDKKGRIMQIGLTQSQSDLLQIFLATISKDSSLVQMGKDYDLALNTPLQQAAPDLLEALQLLVENNMLSVVGEALAEAAIQKATKKN